jgi:3',5'-cyclic AMP phosphodiesterase CpdA
MFTLAHLSDPHLSPFRRPGVAELASKRLLGYVNWRIGRHACHRPEIADAITADVIAAAPDHVAVTGDLVNIALPDEFAPARAWLDRFGPPDRVSFVPGNHDIYVRVTAQEAERCWGTCMIGDGVEPGHDRFPFVRRRGPVALVGLSSALPTAPFMASGGLGAAQIERLAALLPKLADSFRVVLIHHPPLGRRPWHKRLTDAAALLHVVRQHGAELVLHGHDHREMINWADGPRGPIPVVGVPSASAVTGSHEDDPAAWHLYHIEGEPGSWRCEMIVRGIGDGRGSAIVERSRQMLSAPADAPRTMPA